MSGATPPFAALIVAVLATAVPITSASSAYGQSVAEQRIAELQPCRDLRQDLGAGLVIGLDRLKHVALNRAAISMDGDDVTVSFEGSLACRTSDSAAMKGDASVDATGSATVHLADCSVPSVSITATGFGGTFSWLLETVWGPVIAPKLEAEAAAMLADACRDFVAGN